jgi:hypothetical protein
MDEQNPPILLKYRDLLNQIEVNIQHKCYRETVLRQGIMIRYGSRLEHPNRIGVDPALSCGDYAAGLSAGCREVCGTSPFTAALSPAD